MDNYLNLLHGETPKKKNLILIYGIGAVVCAILFWYYNQHSLFERALIGAIGLDIVGGIIANLTHSTKSWWQRQSNWVQYTFLAVHIIHPIAFAYLAHLDLKVMLLLFVYVWLSGFILINLKGELNRIFTIIFGGLGIFLFLGIGLGMSANWFIIAYILKLVVGFCIKEKSHEGIPVSNKSYDAFAA